ncbi:SO_0444 family Cu/Zn efflux transporter [bacterium]|nr:SO_0444 family Cu/Zn efflux transporter [bacterium]
MNIILDILSATLDAYVLAAPFLLFGLAGAGLLHVALSRHAVERHLGGGGMGSVARAAAFGIPLPICSCGVVPIGIELSRKGASRPATMSFLITTPESSADAILLTWGMLGPFVAIARPIASFFTAVLAGVFAMFFPARGEGDAPAGPEIDEKAIEAACCDSAVCNTAGAKSPDGVGFAGVGRSIRNAIARKTEPGVEPFGSLLRRGARYAFVEVADDILFWLFAGLLLTGVITVLVPNDLASIGLGGGHASYLVMLAAGIPLYMCASASTPVAAALVAKGVSPGAALVFLLSGPATNAATVVVLRGVFGRGFVRVYLAAIALGALAAGFALDFALASIGVSVVPKLAGDFEGAAGAVMAASAAVLGVLSAWRFSHGAANMGLRELRENFAAIGRWITGNRRAATGDR